jgi:large subunit ribosomal protein L5
MDLKNFYHKDVKPKLVEKFGFKNQMAVPKIEKVIVSTGLGEAVSDDNVIEKVTEQLNQITGQKAKITLSKKAISSYKLRKGQPIGLMVTLRGVRMYDFLQRLFGIVLPRLRDFQGVSGVSFDKFGNYNLGISDISIFPEVDFAKLDKNRGLQINIVTSAKNNSQAKSLLEFLGMPFEKK